MNSFQQTFRHLVDASDVLAGPPLHPAPSSIPPASSCSSGPTPSSSSSSGLPPSFSSFIGPTPASFSSSGPLEFITSVEVFPGIASVVASSICRSDWITTWRVWVWVPLHPVLAGRASSLGLLQENMDWNTRLSNTTLDTRLPDPDVERCWLYPYIKRLGGLPPRLQPADFLPAPICMEVPGLPEEPACSHSQHDATHPEGLLLPTETNWSYQEHQDRESHYQLHSSNCWLLPQRKCFQLCLNFAWIFRKINVLSCQ